MLTCSLLNAGDAPHIVSRQPGHFGSYLLGIEDRPLVVSIVQRLAAELSIPVFCKIRLLDTVPETIALCKALVKACERNRMV